MNKKISIALFSLLFSAGTFAKTLNIGTLPAADSAILYVAQSEGLFQKEGLDVKLIPFKSAVEVGAAMRAGKLSGHFADIMNVISQAQEGIEQKIVVATTNPNSNQRSFGFMVSPKFASQITNLDYIKNHKGVTTSISSGTIIDYLFSQMTEMEKVDSKNLKITEVKQIPIRLQLLMTGQIQTGLFPEPLVSVIESKGGKCIWDDRSLKESLAVISLKKEFLEESDVKAFRSALGAASKLIEANPNKYKSEMVKWGLLPAQVEKSYEMPKFSFAPDLSSLPSEKDIQNVIDWMKAKGTLKVNFAPSDLVYSEKK